MLITLDRLRHNYTFPLDSVLHVGGSNGEEFGPYIEAGVKELLWVEPRAEAFAELDKLESDVLKSYAIQAAAGNGTGPVTMYPASNGDSSSLLVPDTHLNHHPDVSFGDSRVVQMAKTSAIWDAGMPHLVGKSPDFVNIDVQGYELEVIKGLGLRCMSVSAFYVEVNVGELYRGCAKLHEIDSELAMYGFIRLDTEITPMGWGDAFYLRKDLYCERCRS